MSTQINAREVLAYLNQLGYTNISAVQLQAFIKDLKKLKKYEELKMHEPESDETKMVEINIIRKPDKDQKSGPDILQKRKGPSISDNNSLSEVSNTGPSYVEQENIDIPNKNFKENVFQSTNNTKVVCPVHYLKRFDSRPKSASMSCSCSKYSSSNTIHVNYDTKKKNRPVTSTTESKTSTTTSYIQSVTDKSSLNQKKYKVEFCKCTHGYPGSCFCSETMRPQSAVIKCNTHCAPPFQKCDPVSLHKYYQRQWKINKIPGENIARDKRFRWCFREKISCGPPVKK